MNSLSASAKGSIKKRCGKWVGQWWEGERRRNLVLGPINAMRKAEARAKLDQILAPINEAQPSPNPDWNLGQFVQQVYLPFYLRKWKRSTADCNINRVQTHIVPAFGSVRLRDFSRDELQKLLDQKTEAGLSFSLIDHLRWDLKQMFEMAVAEGCIQRNPAALLFTPQEAKRPIRTSMTVQQVITCLSVLDQRERLIVKLAILVGLRPGEIFGLKWSRVRKDAVEITQRIYRGHVGTPKTNNSVREAAISPTMAEEFDNWRSVTRAPADSDWVFPTERLKTALSKDNCWRRRILPRLKPAGLGWANFQVMRRTHSSLMNDLKVDPKLVADQLGHTVDVNQNVYTRTALSRRQAAVEMLESMVNSLSGVQRSTEEEEVSLNE